MQFSNLSMDAYAIGSVYWGVREANEIGERDFLRVLQITKTTKQFIYYKDLRVHQVGASQILHMTAYNMNDRRMRKSNDHKVIALSKWDPLCILLERDEVLCAEHGAVVAKNIRVL